MYMPSAQKSATWHGNGLPVPISSWAASLMGCRVLLRRSLGSMDILVGYRFDGDGWQCICSVTVRAFHHNIPCHETAYSDQSSFTTPGWCIRVFDFRLLQPGHRRPPVADDAGRAGRAPAKAAGYTAGIAAETGACRSCPPLRPQPARPAHRRCVYRVVELDRPWVVVNLVAVPEFSLEPHRWCYPVLGCQAYRGYFKLEQARKEEARFRLQGYDTFIGGVTAYSTLGWFDDPLHTGFTRLSDDRMVALMFHELAHQVVYMAEDTAFNESFATAVELEGLRLWLEQQNSAEDFDLALLRQEHRNQTLALVEATTAELEQLYNRQDRLTPEQLREHKAGHLEQLAQAYARLADDYPEPGPFGAPPVQLNNANLALFRQYNQHVPAFRQLLRELDYNFGEFYRQVEQLSGQPEAKRRARLAELSHRFDEHL